MTAQEDQEQIDSLLSNEFFLFSILTTQRDLFEKYYRKVDLSFPFVHPILMGMIRRGADDFERVGIYRDWRDLFSWAEENCERKHWPETEIPLLRKSTERTIEEKVTGKHPQDLEARLVILIKDLGTRQLIIQSADSYKKGDKNTLDKFQKFAESLATFDRVEDLRKLDTTNLSTVERQEISWFWKDRIPGGKLSIIVGTAGVGKSWFSLWMASRVTRGDSWPDWPSVKVEKGRVLILANEDGLSDTIVARVQDCGGDLGLVEVINGTVKTNGNIGSFNLARDIALLEKTILELGDVKLIIIDPIKAYLGVGKGVDSNNDQDVRAVLMPLCKLAEVHDVTVIGIMHFNKKIDLSAQDRISGSTAWGAAARSVWMLSWDPENTPSMPKRRIFSPVKNNLSPISSSVVFSIEDGAVKIESCHEVFDPDEIIKAGSASFYDKKGERAKELLTQALELEPDGIEAMTLIELAQGEGICEKTLRIAKKELGIQATKKGSEKGAWIWNWPPNSEETEESVQM